jgi:hypothetical protein
VTFHAAVLRADIMDVTKEILDTLERDVGDEPCQAWTDALMLSILAAVNVLGCYNDHDVLTFAIEAAIRRLFQLEGGNHTLN